MKTIALILAGCFLWLVCAALTARVCTIVSGNSSSRQDIGMWVVLWWLIAIGGSIGLIATFMRDHVVIPIFRALGGIDA